MNALRAPFLCILISAVQRHAEARFGFVRSARFGCTLIVNRTCPAAQLFTLNGVSEHFSVNTFANALATATSAAFASDAHVIACIWCGVDQGGGDGP